MSNTEVAPSEITCSPDTDEGRVELVAAREVPLGGPRAITVRRTLPTRARTLIGAWCFADHYGPVTDGPGMDVPPHPHTGLQTVSWLFSGEVEHRDSLGTHATVRPGELNLMTSGAGICHSEVSRDLPGPLHGVQLWVALPNADRHGPRRFEHHAPPCVDLGGARARVFLGELAGERSPVPTFSPLLGAELVLDPGAVLDLPVDPAFEHGVLVDTGEVTQHGTPVGRGVLGYVARGSRTLPLANPSAVPARVVLLGGEPFGEDLLMWWNFVGRDHDEIVAFREAWERGSQQFGEVVGYEGRTARLPAPPLPGVRIRPRHQA
ncbi:pirin family protein [Jatrophihabitans fulvus]